MSVTSTPSTVPAASAPQSGRPSRDSAAQPAPSRAPESTRAPSPVAEAPKPSASPPPAIGFSLLYDPETRRMILEAREPVSGFVIYQMPPKYVIKQFSASIGSIAPLRGEQVDSAV